MNNFPMDDFEKKLRFEETRCPQCGKKNNANYPLNEEETDPDQDEDDEYLSVCSGCGGINVFADGHLRPMTEAELAEMQLDEPEVFKSVMDGVRMYHQHHLLNKNGDNKN